MAANYYTTANGVQYVMNYPLPNGSMYNGPVSGIPNVTSAPVQSQPNTPPPSGQGSSTGDPNAPVGSAAWQAAQAAIVEQNRLNQVKSTYTAVPDGTYFKFSDSDNVYTKQGGQLVNYGPLNDNQFRQLSGGQSSQIVTRLPVAQADIQKVGVTMPSSSVTPTQAISYNGNPIVPTQGTAWSSGDYALVKFAEDPDGSGPMNTTTVFLMDKKNNMLRPFMSEQAFNNFFGGKTTLAQEAQAGTINLVHIQDLQQGNILGGYKLATNSSDYIDNTGKWSSAGAAPGGPVDTAALGNHYGKPGNQQALEAVLGSSDATNPQPGSLEKILDLMQSDPNIGLAPGITNEILGDPNMVAKYANALAYGGYSPYDIMLDVKRYDAAKKGDTHASSTVVISDSQAASDYYNSAAYKAATSYPNIQLPSYLANVDTAEFKYPLYQISGKAFTAISAPVDWTDPAMKAKADQISAALYDVTAAQLGAQTEQAKAVADANYQQFRSDIAKQYGITLSADASTAWDQLQSLFTAGSQAGILNTGMFQEAQEKKLQDMRKVDAQNRDQKATQEETQRKAYYQGSATPAEIAALSPEDKAKYGLTPSDATRQYFSTANLKSLYPTLTDEQIAQFANSYIDENGNYRSALYQNYQTQLIANTKAKETYQQSKLLSNADLADQQAMRSYDAAGLGENSSGDPTSTDGTTSSTGPTTGQPGSVYDSLHPTPTGTTPPPTGAGTKVTTGGWYKDSTTGTVLYFSAGQNIGSMWSPTTAPSGSTTPSSGSTGSTGSTGSSTSTGTPTTWSQFTAAHPGTDWSKYVPIPYGHNSEYSNAQAVGNTLYGLPKATSTTPAPATTTPPPTTAPKPATGTTSPTGSTSGTTTTPTTYNYKNKWTGNPYSSATPLSAQQLSDFGMVAV